MATETDIANLALQILEDQPITSLADDNTRAREIRRAYEPTLRSLLRTYDWNFARRREVLAPDSTPPAFGRSYQYSLPAKCVCVRPTADDVDWIVENKKVLTDEGPALNLIYTVLPDDTSTFDDIFVEAFAAKLAYQACGRITGAMTKRKDAKDALDMAVAEAKKANAFENQAKDPPIDDWLLARY